MGEIRKSEVDQELSEVDQKLRAAFLGIAARSRSPVKQQETYGKTPPEAAILELATAIGLEIVRSTLAATLLTLRTGKGDEEPQLVPGYEGDVLVPGKGGGWEHVEPQKRRGYSDG